MKPDTQPPIVIQINPDQYEEISRLAELTRKPVSDIAAALIGYGLAHSSVMPIHLYDLVFDKDKEEEKT